MKQLHDLCKLLNNPRRLDLLVRIYVERRDGLNVGLAVEDAGLKQPSTSAYLRQLEDIGVIRRERSGRFVNYYANARSARDEISVVADMIMERVRRNPDDRGFAAHFAVLMNPFRLRVLHCLCGKGSASRTSLCEKFDKEPRILTRDLKPAVAGGLLALDEDDNGGTYRYLPPDESVTRRIIELAR